MKMFLEAGAGREPALRVPSRLDDRQKQLFAILEIP
jgi:hypothetical protein